MRPITLLTLACLAATGCQSVLEDRVNALTAQVARDNQQLTALKTRLHDAEFKLQNDETRWAGVRERLDVTAEQSVTLEARVDRMNRKVDAVDDSVCQTVLFVQGLAGQPTWPDMRPRAPEETAVAAQRQLAQERQQFAEAEKCWAEAARKVDAFVLALERAQQRIDRVEGRVANIDRSDSESDTTPDHPTGSASGDRQPGRETAWRACTPGDPFKAAGAPNHGKEVAD
jgi:hypothetical protein